MNYISELRIILGQQLSWHKSRLDCFAGMLLALFTVRSVNLSEIAVAMQGKVSIHSRYKRVLRFFAYFEFDFGCLSCWIYALFFINQTKVYLAMDRTNWYWGKKPINVLMLSICYEGIAIPLFWTVLKKAGSSNAHEQIELLSRFVKVFGKSVIQALLADREFPSKELISWLVSQNIPFYLRMKGNVDVGIKNRKKFRKSAQLFSQLGTYQHKAFGMKVYVFGQELYLAASKNSCEQLMIIVTNQPPKNAIACYLRRWEIETLFSALKSKGWRFEDTHVTDQKRIQKILALLAIGFVWAHRIGEWKASVKPIALKTLRNQRRPQNSFFRWGLDNFRDFLTDFSKNTKDFLQFIQCLIPQPENTF